MHKTRAEARRFVQDFLALYQPRAGGGVDVGFAPPFTAIESVISELGPRRKEFLVGAQNVHWENDCAHTGEVSPKMLAELGVDFAIIGHSERRQFYGETCSAVAKRARAAIDAGLDAVVCIGETKEQFEKKETAAVVQRQLEDGLKQLSGDDAARLVIAYEPIWAIGTGLAATPQIAAGVHVQVWKFLETKFKAEVPILYGGSMKADNIASLVTEPHINGGLVGGASIQADSWWDLIHTGRNA